MWEVSGLVEDWDWDSLNLKSNSAPRIWLVGLVVLLGSSNRVTV